MGKGELTYLILALVAFAAFALAAVVGIMKYGAWKERRGGTADTGLGPNPSTPPSYPPEDSKPNAR